MTVWEKHKQQKVLVLSKNVTGKFTASAALWLLVFFCQAGKAILRGDRVTGSDPVAGRADGWRGLGQLGSSGFGRRL